ncbi:MAG: translation initiation factor IF-2 N-terminal domain-containing protein, partial [Lachnospiraceae bacterium]
MAKRVYELAKEIGVDNASLMKFLTDNNIEVKSHMSNLDDSAIAMVKSDFKKPAAKPAPAKTEEKPVTEGEKAPERPKKKASITAVFNPQNSKNMKDRKPPQKRPAGERPVRPAGERPVRPAGERPVRPA